MDCAAEEGLVRMKLEPFANVHNLEFDLTDRRLVVFHEGGTEVIVKAIKELNLGSTLLYSETVSEIPSDEGIEQNERKLLWTVLFINFSFFLIEIVTGFVSRSMGLVADSLDMLADAFVYGLSLFAVGKTLQVKKNVARTSGYLQLLLAITGFAEVVRRFISVDETPAWGTMVIVSVFALLANAISLFILQKSKNTEAHIKASMIFTSNDIVLNIGVITAGGLVWLLNSNKPDLIVGTLVFLLVTRGAFRILSLAK